MLDLMQPQAAERQLIGFGGEARRDEAGRKSTRTSKHDVGKNRQRWPLEGTGARPPELTDGGLPSDHTAVTARSIVSADHATLTPMRELTGVLAVSKIPAR